ncbi:MAG: hypothetical protein AAGA96_17250 [Verrucomicrobiota bacterium]
MKTRISKLVLICLFFTGVAVYGAAEGSAGTQLSEAIASFNEKSRSDSIGASQPPITEDEVAAAILLWERPPNAPISEKLLASFREIAASKILPDNASFESLNGYDRGGSHVFDVWSVRVRMEREDGSSYAFVIRERVVGARTLEEELKRLNALIEQEEVKRWVGGHRILERKKALETRIKAASK